MKESNIAVLLDQRKPFSHIGIIAIAFLVTFFTAVREENTGSLIEILSTFLLIVALIEVFIFIYGKEMFF